MRCRAGIAPDHLVAVEAEVPPPYRGGLACVAPRTGSEVEPVIYYPHEATPEIVEAHLRADRNLTPETANALSELFRVAYQQFSGHSDKK